MKTLVKSLNRLVLVALAGFGVASLVLPQASRADDLPRQVEPLEEFNSGQNDDVPRQVRPLEEFNSDQNSNPFSRSADSFGMLDIIRRATSNTRNWDDYTRDQNEDLNSAAAEFRARQRQLIQNPQQVNPDPSVTQPQ